MTIHNSSGQACGAMIPFSPNPHFSFANAIALIIILTVAVCAIVGLHQAKSLSIGLTDGELKPGDKAAVCMHVEMSANFVHWAAVIAFVLSSVTIGVLKRYQSGWTGGVVAVLDAVQIAVNLYLLVALSHTKDMAYQSFGCPKIVQLHAKDKKEKEGGS